MKSTIATKPGSNHVVRAAEPRHREGHPARHLIPIALLATLAAVPASAGENATPNDLFVIKTSAKSPEAVFGAIKTYVADKKWLYLGDNTVKNGEVTLVKLCVPSAAKDIWAAGLHVSALAPCGHVGIYREAGQTKVSMLHPKFMNTLNPHQSLKKVGDELAPLFTAMLDEVTR
jgi:hypothetical protein